MSNKEITITNANAFHKFICFRINGLEDGITVGIVPDPNSHDQALSIAYKGETKIVPFNANSQDIKNLNKDDKIVISLSMDKETYDWMTTPGEEDDDIGYWQPDQVTELDDEAYDKFEKEVMNPEPDIEKVEAAKKIFEGVDKVPVDTSDLWKYELTYGKPHLLELMDEWGINGSNYNDFRNVIQEHCFNKGLYAFIDIEKTWKSHVNSLKSSIKHIKTLNGEKNEQK